MAGGFPCLAGQPVNGQRSIFDKDSSQAGHSSRSAGHLLDRPENELSGRSSRRRVSRTGNLQARTLARPEQAGKLGGWLAGLQIFLLPAR